MSHFKLLTPNKTNYSRHYIMSFTLKMVNNTVNMVICDVTAVKFRSVLNSPQLWKRICVTLTIRVSVTLFFTL